MYYIEGDTSQLLHWKNLMTSCLNPDMGVCCMRQLPVARDALTWARIQKAHEQHAGL